MADSGRALKRGAGLASRLRVRKARSQLLLSRRCRRRLGAVRRCERRRLRRRLLLARAAGADWRDACKPLARKPGAAARPLARPEPAPARARTPSPAPAPAPCRSVCTSLLTEPFRLLGPGRAMMVLAAEKSFTFSGICRVTCLYGQVEVFGHTMNPGQPAQDVFSTYTNAYLTINALRYSTPEKSKKEIKRELRTQFKSLLKMDDRRWAIEHFSPLCSIVMLEKLQTSTVDFLNSYPGVAYVFLQEPPPSRTKYEYLIWKCLGIVKQKSKKSFCLSESALSAVEELVSVSCEADACPIILVCGPQDIGKSTFNRYLINQLLNSISCVDYLECDLGQTEFTPPGCISLLTVTEPVLGPPFTHQRVPQKMVYFGKTSCHNDCSNYIEVVKYVFSAYKRDSPLIVNTMGWMSDDGLLLLVDLIRLLAPSHVVQLTSHYTRHLPLLTLHYVDSTDGLYTKCRSRRKFRGFEIPEFGDNLDFIDEEKDSSPLSFTGHKLVCVNSEFPCSKNPRNRDSYNRIFRDLAVLGYLSQLMSAVPKPLSPLHGLTPYQVPFSAVALRITHSDVAPTHILYAMNASWLGLCSILEDVRGYTKGPVLLAQTPICDCLGFGLCRGVDMDRQLYHILTPLPPEDLRTVNCLLIGCVSVPQCLFKSQPGLEGTIPYVTTDYNFKLPGASEKIGVREAEEYEDNPFAKYRFYQKINQSARRLSYQSSLFPELGPSAGRFGGPRCLVQSVEP